MKRFLVLSLVVALSACANFGDKGTLSEEEIAAQQAEAARQEAARLEEERRAEQARIEEERRAEEERQAEQARAEEERRQEEERLAEEQRQWEELRREQEARLEEERRQEELAQIEALRQQRIEDDDDPELVGMVTEDQLREADPLLLDQSIFYDFDNYNIKPKYAPVIAAHARFLIEHPSVKIFVEGNCDDRGSPEYNIALGQRRSDAVQRALLALGVPARQIEAVSFGAERPVAYGANEESWARNRRADIAYPMFKN